MGHEINNTLMKTGAIVMQLTRKSKFLRTGSTHLIKKVQKDSRSKRRDCLVSGLD